MTTISRYSVLACAVFGLSSCANEMDGDPVAVTGGALTEQECMAAADGNKVAICHATGSTDNPYVLIDISVSACKAAHSDHADDVLPGDDGSCPTGGGQDECQVMCRMGVAADWCSDGHVVTCNNAGFADCCHGGGGDGGGGGGGGGGGTEACPGGVEVSCSQLCPVDTFGLSCLVGTKCCMPNETEFP